MLRTSSLAARQVLSGTRGLGPEDRSGRWIAESRRRTGVEGHTGGAPAGIAKEVTCPCGERPVERRSQDDAILTHEDSILSGCQRFGSTIAMVRPARREWRFDAFVISGGVAVRSFEPSVLPWSSTALRAIATARRIASVVVIAVDTKASPYSRRTRQRFVGTERLLMKAPSAAVAA